LYNKTRVEKNKSNYKAIGVIVFCGIQVLKEEYKLKFIRIDMINDVNGRISSSMIRLLLVNEFSGEI
jgi:hypothetical protein